VPLVVLDRDGVINADSKAYIKSPEEWRPLPGSLEAIAALTAAGWRVAVASNQSGVARGLFDSATLAAINAKMEAAVRAAGGELAAIFFCPHGPDDGCACRKPKPGLLYMVAERFGVDLRNVPVIGDSARDLAAAEAVGARPILVLTGNGPETLAKRTREGRDTERYADLRAAASALLNEAAA
jgi:D-glycero-D-manno-heptose 1,7-bisphosphate phosphatase